MAYNPVTLRVCQEQITNRRMNRELALAQRRDEVYRKIPAIAELDTQMRTGFLEALSRTFGKGPDAESAMEACREHNLALRAQRSQLLVENDFSLDTLDDNPICAACGDMGYTGSQPCTCLQTLYIDGQRQALGHKLPIQTYTFDTFDASLYDAQGDPAYGLSPQDNAEFIFERCIRFATRFGETYENMYLNGAPGTGKTFLCACIAGEVTNRGFWVEYESAIPFLAAMETDKFSRDTEETPHARSYFACDLMILDDLGSEFVTPFVQSALYQFIAARLAARKATIVVSSLTSEELRKRYMPAIVSRLAGEYANYYLLGNDIRPSVN